VPTIDEFLSDLASAEPIPGGGSVAALQTAMAAALLSMVSDLTLGRKKYADVQEEVAAIKTRSEALREQASRLVDEDIEAYGAVAHAMTLPRETEEEKAHRRAVMQDALKGAAVPPLGTMRVASEVLTLARELVKIGNRSAISDVGTAALGARAGYHAARLNVDANVASVRDPEWVAQVERDVAALPSPDDLEREVVAVVEEATSGK
jgi:formiminotetrahydrofolate cyclodeaminase